MNIVDYVVKDMEPIAADLVTKAAELASDANYLLRKANALISAANKITQAGKYKHYTYSKETEISTSETSEIEIIKPLAQRSELK